MRDKNHYFIWILVVLLMGIIAIFIYRYSKNKGIAIKASNDMEFDTYVYYSQKDVRWADDTLGNTTYTMKKCGCLTTCIAASVQMQVNKDNKEYELLPGELNKLFSKNKIYNSDGCIIWNQIGNVLEDVEVIIPEKVDNNQIDDFLDKGCYPIVKVKNHGDGAYHWVLLVGSKDGIYYCMDPLVEDEKIVSLEEHGNIIYAVRCVCLKTSTQY